MKNNSRSLYLCNKVCCGNKKKTSLDSSGLLYFNIFEPTDNDAHQLITATMKYHLNLLYSKTDSNKNNSNLRERLMLEKFALQSSFNSIVLNTEMWAWPAIKSNYETKTDYSIQGKQLHPRRVWDSFVKNIGTSKNDNTSVKKLPVLVNIVTRTSSTNIK